MVRLALPEGPMGLSPSLAALTAAEKDLGQNSGQDWRLEAAGAETTRKAGGNIGGTPAHDQSQISGPARLDRRH